MLPPQVQNHIPENTNTPLKVQNHIWENICELITDKKSGSRLRAAPVN